MRTMLLLTMPFEGIEIVAVATLHEAVTTFDAGSFDAMIVDLELDDGLGSALLERSVSSGTPLILHTGHDPDDFGVPISTLPPSTRFMPKGATPAQLAAAVRTLVATTAPAGI